MTKSKRIFFCAIVTMLALAGCSTMTKAEREAKRAERAEYVKKTLDDRHYKIDIDMMHTRRIGSNPVSSDWSLEVKGDTGIMGTDTVLKTKLFGLKVRRFNNSCLLTGFTRSIQALF